jgi:hypothetical protein
MNESTTNHVESILDSRNGSSFLVGGYISRKTYWIPLIATAAMTPEEDGMAAFMRFGTHRFALPYE